MFHARGRMAGEAAHVQLVDHRSFEGRRPLRRRARHNVRSEIGDDRAHRGPRAAVLRGCTPPIPANVAHGVRPGVAQFSARIDSPPIGGGVCVSIDPPGVMNACRKTHDEHMPYEEGAVLLGVERNHLKRLRAIALRVQQKLDARRVVAQDREVHALWRKRCARRVAGTRPRRVPARRRDAHPSS